VVRGIGDFSVRFGWVIVVAWVVVTIGCVRLFPGLNSVTQGHNSAFLPPNSPFSSALELAAPFQNKQYAALTVVAARNPGPLTAADQATVDQLESWLRGQPHVKTVLDTGVSRDGAARPPTGLGPDDLRLARRGGTLHQPAQTVAWTGHALRNVCHRLPGRRETTCCCR
jgi:uncharacterized membrane protein YdfJ with MMPL/SSD domain